MFVAIILLSLCCTFATGTENDPKSPDPENFKVWGPGLESDFHMPVRYFFIQTVSHDGKNITERLPDIFQVSHVMNNVWDNSTVWFIQAVHFCSAMILRVA